MTIHRFQHVFVESFPDDLEPSMLYVSMDFASVAHKCACGCGLPIYTPLTPLGWRLIYDGESISLYPSLAHDGAPCRSHYWIQRNTIRWGNALSKEQAQHIHQSTMASLDRFYEQRAAPQAPVEQGALISAAPSTQDPRWKRIWRWLFGNRR
jgi:hypothetical protein